MRRADREARMRKLGRFAYRLMISADIYGIVTVDGEAKMLRTYERGRLSVDFYEPSRGSALPTEFSRIVIRYARRKVFEFRWNAARDFKIVTFEPSDEWIEALIDESEANYF